MRFFSSVSEFLLGQRATHLRGNAEVFESSYDSGRKWEQPKLLWSRIL